MNQKSLLFILGGNFYIFLQSLEGFFRAGAAIFAFAGAALSVTLIVWKDRHTLLEIIGRPKEKEQQQDDQTPVG